MSNREKDILEFLALAGWDDGLCSLLAGDASNRRYFRVIRPSNAERVVLMDAPPEKGEDVRPFVVIAEYLSSLGLSSPRIYAEDEKNGFLLLEDLGDELFARVIPRHPEMEPLLYETATDLLVDMHTHVAPSDLGTYDNALAAELSALAFDWYISNLSDRDVSDERKAFCSLLQSMLVDVGMPCDVMIQRDYHAENLLWLAPRKGLARVGLLDFQDAMLGHRAYDLVSLLQDARRDVPPEIEARMIARYVEKSDLDPVAFTAAYSCWGAQRNLRIIGVFARLCVRDSKPSYIDLIPRVWALLQRDLTHPILKPLRDLITEFLPQPDEETLISLKAKCRENQTP